MSRLLILSNTGLPRRAKALQSLAGSFRNDLRDGSNVKAEWIRGHHSEVPTMLIHGVKSIFNEISSSIGDMVLYVVNPILRPLPTIDPKTTAVAQNRLQELTAAQAEPRLKVKELLRTQEDWAAEELERMKQRRVAYATATNAIIKETTKVMLQVVQEAKLSVAGQIREFTDQLTQDLMASLQPELSEYHSINDQNSLVEDKVFVEVDIMEAVETVEDNLQSDVDAATSTLINSLEQTVQDAQEMAVNTEAGLEDVVQAVEDVIERAETQLTDGLAASVEERERELEHEHDAAETEIDRLTAEEIDRLRIEGRAAEELARATLLSEEAVLSEVEEARHALDAHLEAGKMELELELHYLQ